MKYFTVDADNNKSPIISSFVKTGVAILVGLIVFFGTIVIVPAGFSGVITRFGAINRVAKPGLTFKMPILEGVVKMDTRTQKDQVEAQSASKDLQTVKGTIAVNYHLNGSDATTVFQNIGVDYQDKVVSPAIQDTFKSITAKYTAQELIEKREEVRVLAQGELSTKLKQYFILVDNFNIVNFDFSDEYNKAIEAKQVAQQNLEKSKLEAQASVTQAQGQADSQKALKDSGALSMEYLQYLALTKWNGILPNYTGGNIPFVNIK